jgi:hypothetical protein
MSDVYDFDDEKSHDESTLSRTDMSLLNFMSRRSVLKDPPKEITYEKVIQYQKDYGMIF